MSSSRPMTAMAAPQATRIGIRGRGSRKRRLPIWAVGIESISLFSAKYEAKKMHSRILENSIGWNSRLPKCTHRRAPLIGEKNSGATRKMPARSSSR